MDTHSNNSRTVQCVVVTPERTVLDTTVDFVALPMIDGELGVLPGRVTRLTADRVPHIGWNTLDVIKAGEIARDLDAVYYANSFACRPRAQDVVVAWTTHERDRFPAIVRRGRVAGVQFHPEKSSRAGVQALRTMARAVVAA